MAPAARRSPLAAASRRTVMSDMPRDPGPREPARSDGAWTLFGTSARVGWDVNPGHSIPSRPPGKEGGLNDAVHRLRGIPRLAVVTLDESDIVRHALVQQIVKAYEE